MRKIVVVGIAFPESSSSEKTSGANAKNVGAIFKKTTTSNPGAKNRRNRRRRIVVVVVAAHVLDQLRHGGQRMEDRHRDVEQYHARIISQVRRGWDNFPGSVRAMFERMRDFRKSVLARGRSSTWRDRKSPGSRLSRAREWRVERSVSAAPMGSTDGRSAACSHHEGCERQRP